MYWKLTQGKHCFYDHSSSSNMEELSSSVTVNICECARSHTTADELNICILRSQFYFGLRIFFLVIIRN
jgi:hypothetical protein